ncbi:hypothetical protein [Bradyrhizobium sp. Leo121]|uniref:hypothetical protein n=1 Tax=Bradyrhizobium sp. Leo121 TaxID=1571195 RepID=UPI001A911881|nr:hypothetical protein [Bradyrhizobium sp. Leo121]
MGEETRIRRLAARSYRIPTDAPEADGTIAWSATTLVLVEVDAGGVTGVGYSAAAPREAGADTIILANGFSCREQIEQCTGRRTKHVAEVIADAMH